MLMNYHYLCVAEMLKTRAYLVFTGWVGNRWPVHHRTDKQRHTHPYRQLRDDYPN